MSSRKLVSSRLREYRRVFKLADAWYNLLVANTLYPTGLTKGKIKKAEDRLLRTLSSARERKRKLLL